MSRFQLQLIMVEEVSTEDTGHPEIPVEEAAFTTAWAAQVLR
jgi:hypothetical protein